MRGYTRESRRSYRPIGYSKFHRNPFRSLGATGVEIWSFPLLWLLAFTSYNSSFYRTNRDSLLSLYIVTEVQRLM